MLAIIAPGQGSQTPGFLAPWLEEEHLRTNLQIWSDAIGLDLLRLGTTADAEEIRDTSNAQPLIVSAGLLAMKTLGDVNFSIAAGHSVGEITAASIAGVISENDAMKLVRERGMAMASAAATTPTGMSAVLGGDREDVVAAIHSLGLTAANENSAGQIVAAGALEALAKLGENPPAGARVRPLAVAGAFHTAFMGSAVEPLRHFAAGLQIHEPTVSILSNRDGQLVSRGQDVLDAIVNQIANPVRWDLCMATLGQMGVSAVLELPPAGTLVGLIKRTLPDVETLALKTPDEIHAARDLISRHSESAGA